MAEKKVTPRGPTTSTAKQSEKAPAETERKSRKVTGRKLGRKHFH